MKQGIYQVTFGTPEAFVPSRYAPLSTSEVTRVPASAVTQVRFSVSRRGCRLVLPLTESTELYGFGLQLRAFGHRGNKIVCRVNADPRSHTGDSHAPVPFFVTNEGWGMYVDTARNAVFQCGNELFDGGTDWQESGEEGRVMCTTDELYAARSSASSVLTVEVPIAEGVDVYFFTGERMIDLVSAYNRLSGGGCMPPLWGLGNFYRCCGYFDETQVLKMAEEFRQLGLPCDILGLEPGWQSRSYSCSFLWSERFPHHREVLRKLQDMGFKINLWEHAFTHPSSPLYEPMKPYAADYLVWSGLVPDFSLPEAREAFASYHRGFCEEGVSGFKLDECDGSDFTGGWSFPDCASFPSGMDGEQYHHLFGMLYAKAIGEALGEKRTLSQVRSLGALAASYPFVLYSDLYEFEDFLRGTVNAGFSGLLWSPEVRHAESKNELLRRLQLVAFSAQSLINAWYLDTMPWIAQDATAEVKRIFETRMRLVPYLYTAFYDYATVGKPPVRALVCDYPEAGKICDEYLFGDLIVAPIAPGKESREVWLPAGRWHGFFDGKVYEGGTHTVASEDIPVFVKDGTLLPLAEPLPYLSEETVFDLELRAFGDCRTATCRLIEDDGVRQGGDRRVLTVSLGSFPASRRYRLKVTS